MTERETRIASSLAIGKAEGYFCVLKSVDPYMYFLYMQFGDGDLVVGYNTASGKYRDIHKLFSTIVKGVVRRPELNIAAVTYSDNVEKYASLEAHNNSIKAYASNINIHTYKEELYDTMKRIVDNSDELLEYIEYLDEKDFRNGKVTA